MRPRFYFLFLVPLLVLGAVFLADNALHASPTQAPNWSLKDINGKTVQLSDFKGKVVVLDFWATWCPPCRVEIPTFIELQKEFEKQGVTVVGVSLDDDSPALVAKFVQDQKINYPIMIGNEALMEKYGVEGIPTTFVIDAAGRIVSHHENITKKDIFDADIKKALLK